MDKITQTNIRECQDVGELRSMAYQLVAERDNLKSEKDSVKATMPLFSALVGGYLGGKTAEGGFWSSIYPGLVWAIAGTGLAYLLFFFLQYLSAASSSVENKNKGLILKGAICVGLFLLGAVLSYKFHW